MQRRFPRRYHRRCRAPARWRRWRDRSCRSRTPRRAPGTRQPPGLPPAPPRRSPGGCHPVRRQGASMLQRATRRRSYGLLDRRALRRPRRPALTALIDEHDTTVGTITVDVVAEAPQRLRVADGLLPLAFIRVDHTLHVRLEFGADAEPILAHHLFEVVQPSVERVAPDGGPLKALGGANVKHQETVDVTDERCLIQVGCQELRMARLHAAVAAHVEIPALFRRDDAHILALRLCAFARATGDRELEFVR